MAQFKALNERFAEWTYFFNLKKWFWINLSFSSPRKEV